jgi:hypothetical protein
MQRRVYQQVLELYLGNNDFDSELGRSFAKFYMEL